MKPDPIFIGGLANSGKTELRQLLESHPNLCLTRRTYMWTRYFGRYGELSIAANLERCLAQMLQNKHIRALEPDVARIRKEFAQGEPIYARLFGLFHSHFAERMGKARWGDQLGSVEHFAGPIFAAFPNAKMVQMIRDPRHTFAEARSRSRQRPGKLGWFLADWLSSVRAARANLRRFPKNFKVVSYETLQAEPQQTLQEICSFIGEEYRPEIFSEADAALLFPATGRDQLAQLARREIEFVQSVAKQELLALGYPLHPTQLSLRDRALLLLFEWPANRTGMVAWTLAHRQGQPTRDAGKGHKQAVQMSEVSFK